MLHVLVLHGQHQIVVCVLLHAFMGTRGCNQNIPLQRQPAGKKSRNEQDYHGRSPHHYDHHSGQDEFESQAQTSQDVARLVRGLTGREAEILSQALEVQSSIMQRLQIYLQVYTAPNKCQQHK